MEAWANRVRNADNLANVEIVRVQADRPDLMAPFVRPRCVRWFVFHVLVMVPIRTEPPTDPPPTLQVFLQTEQV